MGYLGVCMRAAKAEAIGIKVASSLVENVKEIDADSNE
jgi:hypothetical protein